MEAEEEWWHKDWKKRNQSWDDWWKDRRQEWDDWKKSAREEMQREEEEYQARMEELGEYTSKVTSKEEEKDGENRDSKATGDGSKDEGGGKDKGEEDKVSEHDEQDVLKGQAWAKWKNRTGGRE